ncbi:MAG: serine/threonine protein kinase, partial [Actinomycetota bacterium]
MTSDRHPDPAGPAPELEAPTETLDPHADREPEAQAAAVSAATQDPPLARGAAVGRFVVLGVEGAGGMGWVFSAWDPKLDRKVALKLLRPRRGGELPDAAQRRLLREAQALA